MTLTEWRFSNMFSFAWILRAGIPSAIPVPPLLPSPDFTQWQSTGTFVLFVVEENVIVSGNVSGMAPSAAAFVAIHEGPSCKEIGSVMSSPVTRENPWWSLKALVGPANGAGEAAVSINITGFPLSSLLGRILVIMDGESAEVTACGRIPQSTSGDRPPLGRCLKQRRSLPCEIK